MLETEAWRDSACGYLPGESYHSRLLQLGAVCGACFKALPIPRRARGYTNQQKLLVKGKC